MKAITSRFFFLGLLTILLLPVNAQNVSYTTSKGLKLGFGLGSSYQTADIENSKGGGFDIWLGTPIYQKEHAFFALDWKFRFLAGYNRAYDHRVNIDGSYNNIQLTHFNYDLELALTLNRLRERTRIILSGFLGAGITHGLTSTDLLDASNNPYDYASILPNRDPKDILADLDQLTDNDFETRLVSRAAILPTAGIFLGYEFSPHFALGVEHKMNFSLNEQNSTFGIDIDNRVLTSSRLDWNNYTSLVFRWRLGGGTPGIRSYSAPDRDPIPTAVSYPPDVKIIVPDRNPYEVNESGIKVLARVFHVSSEDDISVKLNGQNQEFLFDPSIRRIEVNTNLQPGSNSLVVSCQNESGSDSDDLVLLYQITTATNPPELKFINPPSSIEVEQNSYSVGIQSRNITSRSDVVLNVNGKRVYNFNYDNNGLISFDMDLNEGRNDIEVSAKNADGNAEEKTNITYVKSEQGFPPEVRFLRPIAPQSNINESSAEILAEIINVQTYKDIRLRINGVYTNDFAFDQSTKRLVATVPLISGTTQVTISVQNPFGSDSDSRTISRIAQQIITSPCPKPIISFTVTKTGTSSLRGVVQNVRDKADILLILNGSQYNNWQFNTYTGEIQANLSLDPGTHIIEMNATNECGNASKSETVVLKDPCLPPYVSMNITIITAENASHLISAQVDNVSDRSNVSLLVNGTPRSNYQFNPTTGQVTATLNLNPGSHEIVVAGVNKCGTDSESKTVEVNEPCDPPSVSFNMAEVSTEDATHRLSGIAQNVQSRDQVTLTVNGIADNDFQFNPSTGEISNRFQFGPGAHTIVLSVSNECGDDTRSKTIDIAKPCDPPSVNFNMSEVNTEDATHRLSGKIQNVQDKSQVSLTVDGTGDSDFQFNPSTGEISNRFQFGPGTHTIMLSVNNECGDDTESKTVDVAEPCDPPSVNFNMSEVNTEDATHQLSGNAQNVLSRDQVTLTVNGIANSDFLFDPSTGEISNRFQFSPGSHTIVLSVNNECGDDTESKTIDVAEPCDPPSVSFNMAAVSTQEATHQLSGNAQNVLSRDQVTLTVNGIANSDFLFDPSTGEISNRFQFGPGTHTIMLSVNNECGDDTESKTVDVAEPCDPPSVNFNMSEVNTEDATHQLSGNAQNVLSRDQVTLTVNGIANSDFLFDPSTGEISNRFQFGPGTYTIMLSVNNECGDDTESKTVDVAEPCDPPSVSFNMAAVSTQDATHRLSGKIQNVQDKSQVSLTVNGTGDSDFQYAPSTGEIGGSFKFDPGTHTVAISVNNDCGSDSESKQVEVEEMPEVESDDFETTEPDAGWLRINPGNASWEFCLQTPDDTFTREDLSNSDFFFSGNADKLFIKPIAGGGTAIVNGSAYNLNPGQYYLFTGNLKVQITNKRQGAMGHWSVYIESSIAPSTGKGNNRPKSPCDSRNTKKDQ